MSQEPVSLRELSRELGLDEPEDAILQDALAGLVNDWPLSREVLRQALGRALEEPENVIDAAHLERQREWSRETFGPGLRTQGIQHHILKEFREIQEDPHDYTEWIDVAILALDGAWRAGAEPQQIIDAIKAKQAKNEARSWPDWRSMPADEAIEHQEVDS